LSIVSPFFGGGSPGAFLGGLVFLAPAIAFVAAEWMAFYRKRRGIERILGFTMLGLTAFALFGVVANVAEAITSDDDVPVDFLLWFISIGLSIFLYFGLCGLFRIRTTGNAT
jgi:hypothetical protein